MFAEKVCVWTYWPNEGYYCALLLQYVLNGLHAIIKGVSFKN